MEVAIVLAWLYSTLSLDPPLQGYASGGVWRAEAPPSTAAPYVIIEFQPSRSKDKMVFGGTRVYSDLFFQVFAAGPAKDGQTVVNAAGRIDQLLTVPQQTAITGGTILASFRVSPLQSDYLIDGEMWSNFGGEYRIMAKAS